MTEEVFACAVSDLEKIVGNFIRFKGNCKRFCCSEFVFCLWVWFVVFWLVGFSALSSNMVLAVLEKAQYFLI